MAQIDDAAAPWVAPMIRGHDTTIDGAGRDRVAAWATKVAITGRAANDPPLPIDQSWADWLRTHRSALPHWHVWIGRYDGTWPYFFHGSDPVIRPLPAVGSEDRSRVAEEHSVHATFFIGYLIVQVFGAGAGGILAERPWPGIVEIWPNDC
jgi:hypothetical protein